MSNSDEIKCKPTVIFDENEKLLFFKNKGFMVGRYVHVFQNSAEKKEYINLCHAVINNTPYMDPCNCVTYDGEYLKLGNDDLNNICVIDIKIKRKYCLDGINKLLKYFEEIPTYDYRVGKYRVGKYYVSNS